MSHLIIDLVVECKKPGLMKNWQLVITIFDKTCIQLAWVYQFLLIRRIPFGWKSTAPPTNQLVHPWHPILADSVQLVLYKDVLQDNGEPWPNWQDIIIYWRHQICLTLLSVDDNCTKVFLSFIWLYHKDSPYQWMAYTPYISTHHTYQTFNCQQFSIKSPMPDMLSSLLTAKYLSMNQSICTPSVVKMLALFS